MEFQTFFGQEKWLENGEYFLRICICIFKIVWRASRILKSIADDITKTQFIKVCKCNFIKIFEKLPFLQMFLKLDTFQNALWKVNILYNFPYIIEIFVFILFFLFRIARSVKMCKAVVLPLPLLKNRKGKRKHFFDLYKRVIISQKQVLFYDI